jgi:hypothetical protein
MKKNSIRILIAGIALLLVAFAWSGFSFKNIGDDFLNIHKVRHTDRTASFVAGDIKNVSIDLSNVKVHVIASAHATKTSVAYYETKYETFTVKNDGGTLIIRHTEKNGNIFCIWRCVYSPEAVTVTLPAASVYGYDIKTDNTSVDFDGALTANMLHAVSDNGNLKLNNVTVQGALNLRSSNAHTTLNNVQAQSIASETDNGGTTLNHVATDSIKATASNAHIDLNHLAAANINLDSSNGGVSGTIAGKSTDYSINATTSNGSLEIDGKKYESVYISTTGRAKSLTAHSSNASISLTFAAQ